MIESLPPVLWAVTTGEAGNISQATGLASALGLPFIPLVGHVPGPWRWMPSPLAARTGLGRLAGPGSDSFDKPWPKVVLACGRRAATLSLAIKKKAVADGAPPPRLIQMLDPQVDPAHFDLVIAPEHDALGGPNVIQTVGAIHRLTRQQLEAGATGFTSVFADLPRPLIAVLVGGKSGAYDFTPENAANLACQLDNLRQQGYGLVITTSRRTGIAQTDALKKIFSGPGVFFWDGTGPNPYTAMLGLADLILVTEESVSMISEACYAGKPVMTLSLSGRGSRRFEMFHKTLMTRGYIRPFGGEPAFWTPPPPLDEATRISHLIRQKWPDLFAVPEPPRASA